MPWQIERHNGLFLPQLDWHLDARKPVVRSFVSHAHFDHMGKHQTILCSPPTAKLIQQRLAGERKWRIYEFGEAFELEPGVNACLYPAGHIIGSSMLWMEKEGQSLLYSGDFKLSRGVSAEPCQPVAADTLIVETTYGLPRYTFPPEQEVFEEIIQFCHDTLGNGDTPVLLGYSLGKSQAILRALSDAAFEVMLHPAALKLTCSCRELGWSFPPHLPFDERNQGGKVLISPPLPKSAPWMQRIRNPKTALISGWGIDPSAVYRYQCDKAFPLSDHADYLDLQNFVKRVAPKTVYTVHGFAREFAETLRKQGYDAWALGQENQLGLDIEEPATDPPHSTTDFTPSSTMPLPPNSFTALAAAAETIHHTDSLRTKTELLSRFLAPLSPEDVTHCLILFTPPSEAVLNELTPKLVRQSALLAAGCSESDFKKAYRESRNSSKAIRKLLSRQPHAPTKTIKELASFLKTLGTAPNPIFKQSLLSDQFRKLSPGEGVYLFQFLCQTGGISVDAKLICQALATRFGRLESAVQAAYLRCHDFTAVSQAAANATLESIRIAYFEPVQPLATSEASSPAAVIERMGLSVWAEPLHDGLRCQIHKNGKHVELYSARRERITHLFPEFVDDARESPQHFICSGVIVPWRDEKPLPLSELEKRLSRKAEELFLGEEIPLVLWLFDLLCLAGEDLLDLPLETRRQKLETLSLTPKIRITPIHPLVGIQQIEDAREQECARGNLGLVCKDPSSPYNPLSTEPTWLSLKRNVAN